MFKHLLEQAEGLGMKVVERNYEQVGESTTVKVDGSNCRIYNGQDGSKALQLINENKSILVNFRRGTATDLPTYKVALFEAQADFEYNGTKVAKGTRKLFAY